MATTNSRMAQRIDTLANWTTNNPLIQPGETCYIEGSTDYRVNTGNTAVNFSDCQLFKGSDTTSAAPGNGTINIKKYDDSVFGSFTVNQSTASDVTLPNFVANAKEDYPTADVKVLVQSDWTPGLALRKKLPNAIPTDLVICIFREWAALLQTNGPQSALTDAQRAIITALGLSNLQ